MPGFPKVTLNLYYASPPSRLWNTEQHKMQIHTNFSILSIFFESPLLKSLAHVRYADDQTDKWLTEAA